MNTTYTVKLIQKGPTLFFMLDGTNQGFLCCKKKKEELEIKYRYLYSQAVMKSASYDSAGKNHGGVYPK